MVGLNLNLKTRATQTQSQMLTPQMQQAIKLLQLSSIELQQQIRQTVDLNPMLEIDDDYHSSMEESYEDMIAKENSENGEYDPFDNDASIKSQEIDGLDSSGTIDENGTIQSENKDSTVQDPILNSPQELSRIDDNYSAAPRGSKGLAIDNDSVYEGETTETLQDHLMMQLELSPLDGNDKLIAHSIIDAIDDSGYLSESVESIYESLKDTIINIELEDVTTVLKIVQHYDPIGVGSRNVQECLLIQLNELPSDTPYKDTASKLIKLYINLLANKDYRGICQKLSLKEEALKKVLALICSLNPRPGNFSPSKKTDFIIPDVIVVKRSDGSYTAELNPSANTKVRINEDYRNYANHATTKEEKQFFKDYMQEANWFIQSIEKRNETLLKVSRCIVEHQKEFMEKGACAMQPMVLNDVATEISMHESTISRITTQKFIYTPQGTYELKYFFSSSVGSEDGSEASSTAINAKIKELVSGEDPKKPLSDNKISDLLNEYGMNVARRTVAKYREAIGIPASSMRKKLI